MALGARRNDVRRLVISDGMFVVMAGAALGIVAAVLAGRRVAPLLFEVSPSEPATYAGVVAVLVATSFVACYLPARRASRVDPVTALRAD